jgi:TonB family protein
MLASPFKSGRQFRVCCLMLWLFAAFLLVRADDRADLEGKLRAEYHDKVLILRIPCAGKKLEFDPDGRPLGKLRAESWTSSAEIEVTDLHLQGDRFEIDANRIFLVYSTNGKFNSLFPVSDRSFDVAQIQLDKGTKKGLDAERKVQITIQLRPEPTENAVHDAMSTAFLRSSEKISDVVPPFWRSFLEDCFVGCTEKKPENVSGQEGAIEAGTRLSRVGGGVSAPHGLYQPDPEYAELARRARFQGTMVLRMVIDAAGKPTDIRIVKPLGLGLDEKGVQAVSEWKFAPAMKDGNPVAVQINVEIEFRLY